MNTCGCGNTIPNERLNLGFRICTRCATQMGTDVKRKGVMVYPHKTGSEIQILSASCYQEQRKYFVPNGARSAVKNFSKHTCS